MKKLKLIYTFAIIISALTVFASCNSTNVEISTDLTYSQMLQKGQDAVAAQDYKLADRYFITCIDTYGADLKCYVETRYELATSFLKQKKYQMSKTMYTEIINIYDRPDAAYLLQPKFKKLSNIQLEKIEAAEKAEQEKLEKKNKKTSASAEAEE